MRDGQQPLDPEMFAPGCPSRVAPIRVGDTWTAMVVLCLEGGPRRFSELQGALRRVTAKVLAETLRRMVRDGLLTRTAHEAVPPHVEYELTPLGRTLLDPLAAARRWCDANLDALVAARAASDASGGA